MEELFCSCERVICQVDGDDIIIKCRHCKRVILIRTKGIINQGECETALLNWNTTR